MNIVQVVDELPEASRAVAVGTFDGVHLGHQRVIDAAKAAGLRTAVVTFDPHPRSVFGLDVELLTTLERRLELFDAAGVEDIVVLEFDEAMANLEPTDFAELILRGMGAEVVAAGETFRFGRDRQGDLELLERLDFDVRRVPVLESVSSSRIRELLLGGEPDRAARLLGRPPEVEGIVVHGDHRGRELGFPTANLSVPSGLLIPPDGVYAGWTRDRLAAISIGTNVQFDGVELRVEAHLLDFDDDLYDQRLVVEVWNWVRGQLRFESVAELIDAIGHDVVQVRESARPA